MATKFGRTRPRDVERGVYRRLDHASGAGIPFRFLVFYGIVAMFVLFGLASRNLEPSSSTVETRAIVVAKAAEPDSAGTAYTVRIRLRGDKRGAEHSLVVERAVWETVEPGMSVLAAVRRGFRPRPVSIRMDDEAAPSTDESRPLFEAIPVIEAPGLPSEAPVP